ncbi:MAG: 16S rRNA (guanine(527)-N(7))-methyltransferase RsmG [Eggerthellaceae bacterium]|nr:16S rRNA (guanine(527)-N(7))-methyltransferase RsmG [Eggerthellaceae bacterium]
METNKRLNLTSIKDHEIGKVLHLEDSLCALPEIVEWHEGLYIDFGSGGGFPGIPLAISTGKETVLVESVKKKAKALVEFCEELDLVNQVHIEDVRIEELPESYKEKAAIVTARALSSIPSLLELASPLLKNGGRLILYKSGTYKDELDRGNRIVSKLGFAYPRTIDYNLSDGTARSLILYSKIAKSQLKLPRRTGLAQNKPLA